MKQILKSWNIEPETMEQIYETAWNVDGKYILKRYTDVDALAQSIRIMEKLKSLEVPVAGIVKTSEGAKFLEEDGAAWFLAEKGINPSTGEKNGIEKVFCREKKHGVHADSGLFDPPICVFGRFLSLELDEI